MQADINVAQCLTSQSHWGYEHYVNLCNGKTYDLQWVFFDYAVACTGLAMLAGLACLVVFCGWLVVTDRV